MSSTSTALMKPDLNTLKAAPGHPVKFWLHRSSFDRGPAYRSVGDWQIEKSKSLYRKNLIAHFGCVNAIEFSNDGRLLVSGGDDRRVLLWNVGKSVVMKQEPKEMQAEHLSNVFSIDFSCSSEKIFSAGNDDQVIVHDVATGTPLDYFVHEQPVYGVSADPFNESVFCSACDDGRILIFDIRESGSEPFCLAKVNSSFHSVMFNPVEPRLVVSSNSKEGVASWDVRMPKRVLIKYGLNTSSQCCMSARFNSLGSQILVLRRRLPPILYSTDSPYHLYQFNHRGYYNSCTMKSCCFAGLDDQFVLSGSDNFDLHLWKIPPPGSDQWVNKADMVLRGHRSIVNQVRYNKVYNVIASSGVEKIVKLWSPFPLPDEIGGKCPPRVFGESESERRIYTPDDYVSLVMQSGERQGQFMSLSMEGDSGRRTTREDSRMLAFFDALVQRDINGFSDDDSDTFPETSYTNTVYSTPVTSSTDDEDEDSNPPNYRSILASSAPNTDSDNAFPGLLSGSATNNHNASHHHINSMLPENSVVVVQPATSNTENGENEPGSEPAPAPRGQSHSGEYGEAEDNEEGDDEEAVVVPLLRRRAAVADDSDEDDLFGNDLNEQTKDRDMTANMITQLILEKEENRRKQLLKSTQPEADPKGNTSNKNSNNEESNSDDSSSSESARSSTSRPLSVSGRGKRRRKSEDKSTSSSYSKVQAIFRRQLLRAKRRERMSSTTPVYESSRNSNSSGTAVSSNVELSFERINELMTRNQGVEQSDSSMDSSSSSSSDSSSSDGDDVAKKVMMGKASKKQMVKSPRSRAILSTDSSSSDGDVKDGGSKRCAVSSTVKDSSSSDDEPSSTTNVTVRATFPSAALKRKRRVPSLNEVCHAYFKKYPDSEPHSRSKDQEESDSESDEIPTKRAHLEKLRTEISTNSATSSGNTESVTFKRLTKHKDRMYRRSSGAGEPSTPPLPDSSTPPDSGIDVSKEPEPCCSKSLRVSGVSDFHGADTSTRSGDNGDKDEGLIKMHKKKTSGITSSSRPKSKSRANSPKKGNPEEEQTEPLTDDPGFGQVESDAQSD